MHCEICGKPSNFFHNHGNHCLCKTCKRAFNLGYQEKVREEDMENEQMINDMAREAGEE